MHSGSGGVGGRSYVFWSPPAAFTHPSAAPSLPRSLQAPRQRPLCALVVRGISPLFLQRGLTAVSPQLLTPCAFITPVTPRISQEDMTR